MKIPLEEMIQHEKELDLQRELEQTYLAYVVGDDWGDRD